MKTDKETRSQGDGETRRHGDTEKKRRGNAKTEGFGSMGRTLSWKTSALGLC